jgi:hypothetical protein
MYILKKKQRRQKNNGNIIAENISKYTEITLHIQDAQCTPSRKKFRNPHVENTVKDYVESHRPFPLFQQQKFVDKFTL